MCRSALVAILALAVFVPPTAGATVSPHRRSAVLVTSTHARPTSAARRLTCVVPLLVCPGGDIVGGVGGAIVGGVGDVVTAGAGAAANTVMSGVVSWAADGAAWLVGEIAKQIERSTRPAIGSAWFERRYAAMVELAVALSAVFLLLAVGQAIFAQDLGRLLRAAFVALPTAMLLTFAAITLVQIGLIVTDWMTSQVLAGTDGEIRTAFHELGSALSVTSGSALAPFALFLCALVVSLLSLLVWLELVMREAAVYVAVAFLPLALVAMVWERTAHWSRRLGEWLLAIILAKFTIAVAFALAASAIVEAPGSGGGLSALLAGCSVLLVAALTPWALLKILPFAEAAAGRTLSRGHVAAAAGSVPGAGTATVAARQLVLKNFAGNASRPAPAAAAGTRMPAPARRPPETRLPELPQGAETRRAPR
jgi:hypothetical protein